MSEEEAQLIGSDYSLPLAKVCAKATYASISCQHDFQILEELVYHIPGRTTSLPSWCVDLAHQVSRAQMFDKVDDDLSSLSSASTSRETDKFVRWPSRDEGLWHKPTLSENLDVLTVTGLNFAAISVVIESLEIPKNDYGETDAFLDSARRMRSFLEAQTQRH